MNPFKELLFLQGHVTQPELLRDAEAPAAEPQPLSKPSSRPLRFIAPALPVGGCG